jgi:hypothetical protein
MPRYYFHVTDTKQVPENHKVMILPGDAASRDGAIGLGDRR